MEVVDYGKDIYESLAEYIMDDRYHQAVLLNGSWGSGKTWFINKQFTPVFEKTHEADDWCFIYLSLYGLKTMPQLKEKMEENVTQKIFERYVNRCGATSEGAAKFYEKVQTASGLLSSVAVLAAKTVLPIRDLPEVKWSDFQKVLPKPKHVIYVMDDLERVGMEVEEVLGYINEMTEHENAKVIILANEEEIYKANDFDEPSNESKGKADLENNVKNTKRARYELIKEKTIGLDMAYQVSMVEIYDSLVKQYVKSERLKLYLWGQKDYVAGIFEDKAGENLRTLIFAFVVCDKLYPMMERVYETWKDEHRQDGDEVIHDIFCNLISDVIQYTLCASIAWKRKEKFKAPTTEFGKLPAPWRVYFPYSYSFVDSFIEKGRLEENKAQNIIVSVLDDLLDTCQGRNEAYKNLMNWQILPDQDIEKYLEQLKQEIPKKKLNPDYIRNLFLELIYISAIGIPVSMQDYVNTILDRLKEGMLSPLLVPEMLYAASYIDNNETKRTYNETLKPIYKFLEETTQRIRMKEYRFLINNEWMPDFKAKCREQEDHFIVDKKFMAYADPVEILKKLKTASPVEIANFRSGISYIYRMSNASDFFQADIPCIMALANGLSVRESTGSKVRDWHLARLEENLKDYLEKLTP